MITDRYHSEEQYMALRMYKNRCMSMYYEFSEELSSFSSFPSLLTFMRGVQRTYNAHQSPC